jgi:hypothetical protein
MSGALVLVDNGLHLAQHEVKRFLEIQERQRQEKIRFLALKDPAVQRRRITKFVRKYHS